MYDVVLWIHPSSSQGVLIAGILCAAAKGLWGNSLVRPLSLCPCPPADVILSFLIKNKTKLSTMTIWSKARHSVPSLTRQTTFPCSFSLIRLQFVCNQYLVLTHLFFLCLFYICMCIFYSMMQQNVHLLDSLHKVENTVIV